MATEPPLVEVRIPGIPVTQGSKIPGITKDGRPYLRDDQPKALKEWRELIARHVQLATRVRGLDGPIRAEVLFRLPATSSWRAIDRARGWRWKDVKPDIDKLQRAVFDALTQNIPLLADDARLVDVRVQKIETIAWTGVRIRLWRLTYEETP